MTFNQHIAGPRTTSQTVDYTMTVMLLVLQGLTFMASVYISLFFVMATDSCYGDCDTGPLTTAYAVTDGGGLVVMVSAIVASLVLLARRRLAFWVPLVGIGLQVVLLMAGVDIASSIM
ncbi:hypothetical protein [Williamsia sp.]|uniref:hypothetical protein n=1 Tax=Williamsia sp. TaxID=1872085 RepID=UPI002F93EB92